MSKKKNSDKKNISLPRVSKSEKDKRAKYLTKRISSLYDDLSDWIDAYNNFTSRRKTTGVEGVKLPVMEILSGKKTILSLVPAGLYAFGFNCQINLKSEKENSLLVDIAKNSDPPDWQLVSSEAGKKPKKLTKMIFRNLLKKQL